MNGNDLKKIRFNLKITQQEAAKLLNVSKRTVVIWEKMEEFPENIALKVQSSFEEILKEKNKKSCENDFLNEILASKNSEINSLKETIKTQKDLISELKEKIETLKNGDVPTALKIVSESSRKYGEKPK